MTPIECIEADDKDYSVNAGIVRFSGTGDKVISNVPLSGKNYIVRVATDDDSPYFVCYDAKGNKDYIVSGNRESVYNPSRYMDFSAPVIIDASNVNGDWSVEMRPL